MDYFTSHLKIVSLSQRILGLRNVKATRLDRITNYPPSPPRAIQCQYSRKMSTTPDIQNSSTALLKEEHHRKRRHVEPAKGKMKVLGERSCMSPSHKSESIPHAKSAITATVLPQKKRPSERKVHQLSLYPKS